MSTPLVRDSALVLPSSTIVSASAGAGKTHVLSLRFLQLLLSRCIPHNELRNIVALTFTNTAAAEMRRRIVESLKRLALGVDEKLTRQMLELVEGDEPELRRRAMAATESILDHYAEFQVRTIDSFMGRVFKASSIELGFPANCDILLDNEQILHYAFDAFAREQSGSVGGMERLRVLVSMLADVSRGGDRFHWDPYGKIVKETGRLLDKLMTSVDVLKTTDMSAEISQREAELKHVVREIRKTIAGSGLELPVLVAQDLDLAQSGEWRSLVERARRESIVKGQHTKAARAQYDALAGSLQSLLEAFNGTIDTLAALYARSQYSPFASALQSVAESIERVKRERSEIAIDDINRMLATYLDAGVVPEIYVILGEEISHYLLDEFQDTSPVQWSGLRVLVENAIAEGGTLFAVGDTKQSIFGFRGADWTIMKGLMDGRETFSGLPCERLLLDQNWRSGGRIVEFVRQVFHERVMETNLSSAARASGLDSYVQFPLEKAAHEGHVEVALVDPTSDAEAERRILFDAVESAVARGYACSDIAILAPSNANVLAISDWLNRRGIPILSYSSLDVRARKLVGEILSLFTFLDTPLDDLSFATFIMGEIVGSFPGPLGFMNNPQSVNQFIVEERTKRRRRPLYIAFRERFPQFWEGLLEQLFVQVGYQPLYDLASEAYKTFSVLERFPEEQAGLVKFLEAVKEFEDLGANSLKEFLSFAAELGPNDATWSVGNQANPDAVTIMTIHKAKGLQFPVVVVLLYDHVIKTPSMLFHKTDGGVELWKVTGNLAKRSDELLAARSAEQILEQTDFLNRLYVALTRAENELYVISVRGKGAIPSSLIPESPSRASERPVVIPAPPANLHAVRPVVHSLPREVQNKEKGRIGFFETHRGDAIHRVLSRLLSIDGDPIPPIQSAIRLEDVVGFGNDDQDELLRVLTRFLSDVLIRPFFAGKQGRKVRTEQEFLSREGRLVRVDRLLEDGDRVTLIDFKTGRLDGDGKYVVQVRDYMEIIREMYPGKIVRAVIAYVDLCQVVEVEPLRT